IHHRGQLTVYLRLIDIPLPQIYGPTADERW
ncbi:MAG: DinB family protein, partial [Bryobacteraceae bacterium]